VAEEEKTAALADFVQARLGRKALIGDRIRLADVDLVVRGVRDERITEVAIELEPRRRSGAPPAALRAWLPRRLGTLRRWLRRSRGRLRAPRSSEPDVPGQHEPAERKQERQ
jgi:NhaP-type Na+/H+ and K+/H+ antiporter